MSIFNCVLQKAGSRIYYGLVVFLVLAFFANDVMAQDYEFTLNQRRRFDQIYVEIWAKSLNSNVKALGNASLVVQYNTNFLSPAATQSPSTTDTVINDVNIPNPIRLITSQFHLANGYNSLGAQSYSSGYYSLEINLASLGTQGIIPSSSGKGSFLGKLIFNIQGNPTSNSLTGIEGSKSNLPGDIRVFDADSNDIENRVTFTDPGNFNIVGITILYPNHEGVVVDRVQDILV